MALQLRRGTNAERLAMTPVNGELIFVTDYELVTTSVTSINTTTDTLTTTAAHGLSVNQQVKYIGATLNGLTKDQVYFVKTAPTITDFTLSTSLGGGTLDITGSFTVPLVFAKTPTTAAGVPLAKDVAVLWIGDGVTVGGVIAARLYLDDLIDVEITSPGEGNTFYYDATTGLWKNTSIITIDDVAGNVTLSGDLAVNGGDITTNVGSGGIANLYNSNAIGTINIGNSVVTAVNIGNVSSGKVFAKTPLFETNSNATIGGDLEVTGGDITTSVGSGGIANLYNSSAIGTINIGNSVVTEVNIGNQANSSKVQIKSPTIVGANATQDVFNTVATTVNAFGAATTALNIGPTASGTTTIGYNAKILNDLTVTGTNINTGVTDTIISIDAVVATDDVARSSLTLKSTSTGTPAIGMGTGINFVGQTAVSNFENAGFIVVESTDITPTSEDFKMKFGLMQAGGTYTTKMDLDSAGNLQIDGDLQIDGGDITTTSANGNLFNATATTVNIGDGATSQVNIGNYGSGTVNIKSQSLLQNDLGGAISTTFNLFNTITTDLNIGGAATTVDIGAAGGTTTIAGNLNVGVTLQTASSENITSGSISLNKAITKFPTTGVNTSTLADGNDGQFKTLVRTGASNSMAVTVSSAGWNGGSSGTINFGDQGDTCLLQFVSGYGWCAVGVGWKQPTFS